MKIVVLAGNNQNLYASALIQKLARDGYPPFQVVLRKNNLINRAQRVLKSFSLRDLPKYIKKLQSANVPGDINRPLEAYMSTNDLHKESISELSAKLGFQILFCNDVNDNMLIRSFEEHRPDLIIYCSGGILRKPLLEVPTIGTLNAHMGLLPRFRGMNVLEWSLFYKAPIGVTIHFIDAGIDTGEIILQQEMDVGETDTINSLRMRSIVLNVNLMAEAVDSITQGYATRYPNPVSEGKQYFVMHESLKQYVERELLRPRKD